MPTNVTKENILLAALNLFSCEGYEAVSVSDIAGSLGMTKSALYKHYGSKRDIFDSIVSRMAQTDIDRAGDYSMPELPLKQMPKAYSATNLERLLRYSAAQVRYWTTDSFAAAFRRMLTLEQYRSDEMASVYQQYLASGPLKYIEDIFGQIFGCEDYRHKRLALEFYAPIYFLISIYDASANKDEVQKRLLRHIDGFADNIEQKLSEYRESR